jgi:hypothetical protein
MPLDLQIIRASEFVRLSPEENLDFRASKEALELLVKACRKRGIDRALLDLRAIPIPPKPFFTPTELASPVETFREAGFKQRQWLAVLYRSDPHHGARLFAFISAMRGWTVRAFDNFEQAVLWLSSNEETEEASNAQPVKIQTSPPRRTKS